MYRTFINFKMQSAISLTNEPEISFTKKNGQTLSIVMTSYLKSRIETDFNEFAMVSRNHASICWVFVALYVVIQCVNWRRFGWESPQVLQDINLEFLSSHLFSFFSGLFLESFLLALFSEKNQRAPTFTSGTVCALVASAHLMSYMHCEAFSRSASGRIINHSIWAEWIATVPLLMYLICYAARVCSRTTMVALGVQLAVICFGYAADVVGVVWVQALAIVCSLFLHLFLCFFVYVLCFGLARCVPGETDPDLSHLNNTKIKLLGMNILVIWNFYPIFYCLHIWGSVSDALYYTLVPLFDVLSKGLFVGIIMAYHADQNTRGYQSTINQLTRKNMAQYKFLRFVFHEIRNPFHSITLSLDQLELEVRDRDSSGESECRDTTGLLFETMRSSVTAMNLVMDDVVELADLQVGMESDLSEIKCMAFLERAANIYLSIAKKKNLVVTIYVDTDLPVILLGDGFKLGKAIERLISNAFKFSFDGSSVEIFAERVKKTRSKCIVRFSVRDFGPGIPKSLHALLFKPFAIVRPGDYGEDPYRGSGLGLSFAENAVHLLGGTLQMQSEEGAGSTFAITVSMGHSSEMDTSYAMGLSNFVHNVKGTRATSPSNNRRMARSQSGSRRHGVKILAHDGTFHRVEDLPKQTSFSVKHQCTQQPEGNQTQKHVKYQSPSGKTINTMPNSPMFRQDSDVSPEGSKMPNLGAFTPTACGLVRLKSPWTGLRSQKLDKAEAFSMKSTNFGVVAAIIRGSLGIRAQSDGSEKIYVSKKWSASPSCMNTQHELPAPIPEQKPESSEVSSSNSNKLEDLRNHRARPNSNCNSSFSVQSQLDYDITVPFIRPPPSRGPSGRLTVTANARKLSSLSEPKVVRHPEILVVDDVQSNLKLAHMILTREGYVCDVANDGQVAVEMAKKNTYQLIFMDNVMPIMDGIQATKHIHSLNLDTTIVGLSGNVLKADKDEFIKAGARYIITKPASRQKLIEACKEFVVKEEPGHCQNTAMQLEDTNDSKSGVRTYVST